MAANGIISSAMNDPNAPDTTPTVPSTFSPSGAATNTNGNISTPSATSTIQNGPSQQLPPTTSPTTTPKPITGASITDPMALQSQINSIYQQQFGRPAEDAGLQYWSDYARQNPNVDLNQRIAQSAQGQDVNARVALGDTGSLAKNWTDPNLNQNQAGYTWNNATGQWQAPKAPDPVAAGYTPTLLGTPTQATVGPQQTVQGQLQGILDPNNPLMQKAVTEAKEQANARGLLNSSIATTGAQEAMLAAGIPIAQADAGTYNTASMYNTNEANTFAQQNANAQNTAGQFNAQQTNALKQTAMQTGTQQDIAKLNADTQKTIATLNNQQQTQLQNMSDAEKNLLASNSGAASAYSDYAKTLAQNMTLNADAQAKYDADLTAFNAYKSQMQFYAQQMHMPDVSASLTFNEINPSTGAAPSPAGQTPTSPSNPSVPNASPFSQPYGPGSSGIIANAMGGAY